MKIRQLKEKKFHQGDFVIHENPSAGEFEILMMQNSVVRGLIHVSRPDSIFWWSAFDGIHEVGLKQAIQLGLLPVKDANGAPTTSWEGAYRLSCSRRDEMPEYGTPEDFAGYGWVNWKADSTALRQSPSRVYLTVEQTMGLSEPYAIMVSSLLQRYNRKQEERRKRGLQEGIIGPRAESLQKFWIHPERGEMIAVDQHEDAIPDGDSSAQDAIFHGWVQAGASPSRAVLHAEGPRSLHEALIMLTKTVCPDPKEVWIEWYEGGRVWARLLDEDGTLKKFLKFGYTTPMR